MCLLLPLYYDHREFLETLAGYKSIKVNIRRENHQNTEKVADRSRVKLFHQRLSTYILTKNCDIKNSGKNDPLLKNFFNETGWVYDNIFLLRGFHEIGEKTKVSIFCF